MARGKCRGKPRNLGSRRGAAALFFGAAAQGCIRSWGTFWAPRPSKGSAAALGYFLGREFFHFRAFAQGARGMFSLLCFGKLEVPRVWDWSREVVLDWLVLKSVLYVL